MSLATINSPYCGLEPLSIVEVPLSPRPRLGSWRGYCNLLMVGATGRNDRSRRWPNGQIDQVAASRCQANAHPTLALELVSEVKAHNDNRSNWRFTALNVTYYSLFYSIMSFQKDDIRLMKYF